MHIARIFLGGVMLGICVASYTWGQNKDAPFGGWTTETKSVDVLTPAGKATRQITYYTNSVGMKFVLVPSGEFMMGSPANEESRKNDEGPQHRVLITKPFYMGAYEVTQAQYENIMDRNPATFRTDQNPVENASWEDAVEFCRRLSEKEGVAYRLPTEAEWEYACRAGSTTPYYTGAKISMDQASYDKKETAPVGSFPPNGLGLFDMHGNVFEWCRDWYSPTYYQSSPIEDPQGTDAATAAGGSDWGETHVVRGGCWGTESDTLRSAFRGKYPPSFMSMGVGFRVVVSAPTP